jgi:hypothetical protein
MSPIEAMRPLVLTAVLNLLTALQDPLTEGLPLLLWIDSYTVMVLGLFAQHVEDHHFYSLNYMHWGAPKVWYGVPNSEALKLESAMKKHLPELFNEQPDLLHKLVAMIFSSCKMMSCFEYVCKICCSELMGLDNMVVGGDR